MPIHLLNMLCLLCLWLLLAPQWLAAQSREPAKDTLPQVQLGSPVGIPQPVTDISALAWPAPAAPAAVTLTAASPLAVDDLRPAAQLRTLPPPPTSAAAWLPSQSVMATQSQLDAESAAAAIPTTLESTGVATDTAVPTSQLPGELPAGLPTALPSGQSVLPPSNDAFAAPELEPVPAQGLPPAAATGLTPPPAGPYFFAPPTRELDIAGSPAARRIPYQPHSFLTPPIALPPTDPWQEASPYRSKYAVPTQRPWVELWRPLYTGGIYPPAQTWLGKYNPVMPHLLVYGDYRTGVGINRNVGGEANSLASRLNLDIDLEITATERVHAFVGPLDRTGDYTRIDFSNNWEFVDRTDMRFDTLFFEGDAGAIYGGLTDQDAPFDLPFSFGFLPLFYQNGIWANDNVIGAAVALPAKNSPQLGWSNYDATFFWASDQINTDAFPGDNTAAEFFGTAWFIEAYDGYIEADYAFVHDDVGQHRSYHNMSVAYTRRYLARLSNSVRYITNFNQSLPRDQRTADGHMILLENSLITAAPNTCVPYLNFFYGQGRTQSLARAGIAGGILNNTGINFETDGLTAYPTLDATGVNASGAALGINMLGADFLHQLILEVATVNTHGDQQFRNANGDQYAVGMRYQRPLSNAWLFRTDHMYGWLRDADDIRGSRFEFRWKF